MDFIRDGRGRVKGQRRVYEMQSGEIRRAEAGHDDLCSCVALTELKLLRYWEWVWIRDSAQTRGGAGRWRARCFELRMRGVGAEVVGVGVTGRDAMGRREHDVVFGCGRPNGADGRCGIT